MSPSTQGKTSSVFIEVTTATVVRTGGTDAIYLKTTLPSGVWPYQGVTNVTLSVAAKGGETYLEKHFPGLPYDVVDTEALYPKKIK